jgi:uncharacterized membrane protein
MELDDNAPLRRSDTTLIHAPVNVVWSVLTDIASWPTWMPDVKSVEADGSFSPGTRFRWRAGSAVIKSEVIEAEPGRSAVWRGRTFGIDAVHAWRLVGRDAVSTSVETEESWSGLLPRVLPAYMGRALAKALNRGLAALKAESERRANRSSS